MNTTQGAAAALVAGLLALTACASDGGSSPSNDPGTKTGGDAGPITITIADSQPPAKPSNLPLNEFASQVESLAGGSMDVAIVYEVEGGDEGVLQRLRAGDVQMAVVPARAWSLAGVDSFRALQAPFLVQSDEQANATVRDPVVVSSAFSGLDAVGVSGLTMFPESLRHIFSYTSPILRPDDVASRQIRYVESPEVATLIMALGATPVDTFGEEYEALVADGTITGFDSGFAIAQGSNPRLATATGNLVLYPKVITFVANSEFWDGLTDEQREALTTAAQEMQDWAITNQVGDREAAVDYCSHGGTVVLTDPQSLADFRAVAAPIYADLERDAEATRMIEAIDALAPTKPDGPVEACSPPGPLTSEDVVAKGGELPNGVFRVEYTDQHLRDCGMAEQYVPENNGVWTYRLDDGHWSFVRVSPSGETEGTDRQAGLYQVEGNTIYWKWQLENEGMTQLTWSVDDDGTLHLAVAPASEMPDCVFGLPWPRIGDL